MLRAAWQRAAGKLDPAPPPRRDLERRPLLESPGDTGIDNSRAPPLRAEGPAGGATRAPPAARHGCAGTACDRPARAGHGARGRHSLPRVRLLGRPLRPLPGRRLLVLATGPAQPGSHRRLSARHGPHRLGAGDDPERRQRGRLLAAELSRQRELVPQGLRAAGVAAARVVGAALRVGQLPRVPSGSTVTCSVDTSADTCRSSRCPAGAAHAAASTGWSSGPTAGAA